MKLIYLDNNATAPLDLSLFEGVHEKMRSSLKNPSSLHRQGRDAKAHLAEARRGIASFLGCFPEEIVFTSGATESAYLYLNSFAKRGHIVLSGFEHPCVEFALSGSETSLVSSKCGKISREDVEKAIRKDTVLIAVMGVSNETGTLNDIEAIAQLAKQKRIPFFCDAVALLGKHPLKIHEGITAMSFSGHKIHALPGTGVLFLRRSEKIAPLLKGTQERGLRGGTENLYGILSFFEAIKYVEANLLDDCKRMQMMRDAFEQPLVHAGLASINGTAQRVCNTSNLRFHGKDAEEIFYFLDQNNIAASFGSACSSGSTSPSKALLSLGHTIDEALSSLRFSFSRMNTMDEAKVASEMLFHFLSKKPLVKK